MGTIGGSGSLAAIHRLKAKIEMLSEQQAEAMKTVMFRGMTSGEAKDYDKRRSRITKLLKNLAIGNEPAADAAAQTLSEEICKAWENLGKQRKKAS